MIRYDIRLPPDRDESWMQGWLHAYAREMDLSVGARTTLRTVPDIAHWHVTRGKRSGTLDFTFDPWARRVTIAVHDNRRGQWAGTAAESLSRRLQHDLAKAM
jgi:hypothetical protein